MSESWVHLLSTTLFIVALSVSGTLAKSINVPPVVVEVAVGVIFGPHALGIVSFENASPSSMLVVFGLMGIAFLMMHSGIHTNISKIKLIGKWVIVTGLLSTIIPLIAGSLIFTYLPDSDLKFFPNAFAAGAAITPASVGVAMRVLLSVKKLNTSYGQSILISAVIDDLCSIMLFIILVNTATADPSFSSIGVPIILALLFTIIALILSQTLIPKVLDALFGYLCKKYGIKKRDNWHIYIMCALLIGYGCIGHYTGSYLLGAFLAGLSFSKVKRSMIIWNIELKPYMSWLLRFFFASTIAFSIELHSLFDITVFWNGCIVAAVCILSKLLAAVFMGRDKWIVGFGLVSRGEFSFLIAEFSKEEGLIDDKVFSMIVWGLILSTFCAPIILNILIKKRLHRSINNEFKDNMYELSITGNHHDGIQHEIDGALGEMGYSIRNISTECDGEIDHDVLTICHKHGENITHKELDEIKENINSIIADKHAKITLTHLDTTDVGYIDIYVDTIHPTRVLDVITHIFNTNHIDFVVYENMKVTDTMDSDSDSDEEVKGCEAPAPPVSKIRIKTLVRDITKKKKDSLANCIKTQCKKVDNDSRVLVRLLKYTESMALELERV